MARKKIQHKKDPDIKGALDNEIRSLMTPQAINELNALTPTIQQFLLRWQDKRDLMLGDQLKEELKEFLLKVYQKDNENLVNSVTTAVCTELDDFIVNVYKRFQDLDDRQTEILGVINKVNTRMEKLENQVFIVNEARLQKLTRIHIWWKELLKAIFMIIVTAGIVGWFLYTITSTKINDTAIRVKNLEDMMEKHMKIESTR